MSNDLRALDEAIARARGWPAITKAARWALDVKAISLDDGDYVERVTWHATEPPAYSASWLLTGILFEEWLDDNALDDLCGEMYNRGDVTPREIVARAWLAWHEARTR